jgi:hypothetical protein
MKTLAAYSTVTEAHVALCRLQSAGVEGVIRDEFMVTCDWLASNAVGGVKIEVIEEDFEAAREILLLPPPETGILVCPHCGASDTTVRTLSVFGAACIVLKLPFPMTRAIVDCRRCGKTHDVRMDGSGD